MSYVPLRLSMTARAIASCASIFANIMAPVTTSLPRCDTPSPFSFPRFRLTTRPNFHWPLPSRCRKRASACDISNRAGPNKTRMWKAVIASTRKSFGGARPLTRVHQPLRPYAPGSIGTITTDFSWLSQACPRRRNWRRFCRHGTHPHRTRHAHIRVPLLDKSLQGAECFGLSQRRMCRLLGLDRQTHRYRSRRQEAEPLSTRIREIDEGQASIRLSPDLCQATGGTTASRNLLRVWGDVALSGIPEAVLIGALLRL